MSKFFVIQEVPSFDNTSSVITEFESRYELTRWLCKEFPTRKGFEDARLVIIEGRQVTVRPKQVEIITEYE